MNKTQFINELVANGYQLADLTGMPVEDLALLVQETYIENTWSPEARAAALASRQLRKQGTLSNTHQFKKQNKVLQKAWEKRVTEFTTAHQGIKWWSDPETRGHEIVRSVQMGKTTRASLPEHQRAMLLHMNHVLGEAPKTSGLFYRGVNENVGSFTRGTIVKMGAHTSVTTHGETASRFAADSLHTPVVLHMRSKSAIDIHRLSGLQEEHEHIIPKGTSFRVTRVFKGKLKVIGARMLTAHHVYLKEI